MLITGGFLSESFQQDSDNFLLPATDEAGPSRLPLHSLSSAHNHDSLIEHHLHHNNQITQHAHSDNVDQGSDQGHEHDLDPNKRSRGRPKGSKNKPRPNARPRPPPPSPKRRGRPPKVRSGEELEEYERKLEEKAAGVKRKKGRPRKFPGYLIRDMRLKKNRSEYRELLGTYRQAEGDQGQDQNGDGRYRGEHEHGLDREMGGEMGHLDLEESANGDESTYHHHSGHDGNHDHGNSRPSEEQGDGSGNGDGGVGEYDWPATMDMNLNMGMEMDMDMEVDEQTLLAAVGINLTRQQQQEREKERARASTASNRKGSGAPKGKKAHPGTESDAGAEAEGEVPSARVFEQEEDLEMGRVFGLAGVGVGVGVGVGMGVGVGVGANTGTGTSTIADSSGGAQDTDEL